MQPDFLKFAPVWDIIGIASSEILIKANRGLAMRLV